MARNQTDPPENLNSGPADPASSFLMLAIKKVKEVKYALAFAAIAAAVAIAASFLKGYLSSIAGVVVAVNMGVMLIFAVLMMIAAARAKGEHAKRYAKMFLILAWVFSTILTISACLSLTSVFFHWPMDFRQSSIEPLYTGDYRVEETMMLMDLRNRVSTDGNAGAISRDIKYRIDRVVRQRPTDVPYTLQWGTNGQAIDNIISSTNPGMTTTEVKSGRFAQTTKHTYISSIPAEEVPLNYPVEIDAQATFVNAFSGETEEWVGACPNEDTALLTMIVYCPENKRCTKARPMEQPIGSGEISFRGDTRPIIFDAGRTIVWNVPNPTKGVGYFIVFNW
jgi:hypothetical protein